ncbi:M64 family metallopeptidase [Gemmatimonadota bacterium]
MRPIMAVTIVLMLVPVDIGAQQSGDFEQWFTDATMRIDYYHTGDADEEAFSLDQVYVQGPWAGSLTNLVDPFDNGKYYIKVRDAGSGELIFTRGFNSYAGEYQTTDPAAQGIARTYHESALIPCPKMPITFIIEVRQRDNSFQEVFSQEIDPEAVSVIRESPAGQVLTIEMMRGGDPHDCVDIAFIAEGYAGHEREKAVADLDRLLGSMFDEEPYRSNREHFNIYGVFSASDESGVDEPTNSIWRRTAVNSSFNALGLPRYLLTEDNRALRDIAANVPYDAIVILVNSDRYGGGGIYNWYAVSTVDNDLSGHVFLHEFGHSFAGLADEYYTSTVAYNEFYPPGVEPPEPNITALLDPVRLKWKHLVDATTPLPTPWEKAEYEGIPAMQRELRREARAEITRLQQVEDSDEAIRKIEEDLAARMKELSDRMEEILSGTSVRNVVGAYEGAGYSSSGLYRPLRDCLMFRNAPGKRTLCAVCQDAVLRMIRFYRGLPQNN